MLFEVFLQRERFAHLLGVKSVRARASPLGQKFRNQGPFALAYNEKTMTLTAYKHITLTDEGVPVIGGTGFKVKQLVGERRAHGSSPEELQFQHPQLSLAQVYSALAYHEDHREEIDAHLREGATRAEELRAQLDAPDLKARVAPTAKR